MAAQKKDIDLAVQPSTPPMKADAASDEEDRISLTLDEEALKKNDVLWLTPPEPGCRGFCGRFLNKTAKAILSFGLFGFLGGITNWLAIKMLFDKVPGLYGSGVIPRRFKEIRETVKSVILRTFFESNYLKKYITEKAGNMIGQLNADDKIKSLLESKEVDDTIERKLKELSDRPEGMVLTMMGLDSSAIKPMVKFFVLGLGSDLAPLLAKLLDPNKLFDAGKLRDEIDRLMSVRLQELTPDVIKRLMEVVMRKHLGWLIIWGNVFGSVLGLLVYCVGFG